MSDELHIHSEQLEEAYQKGRAEAIDDAKDFIHKAIAHDGRNGWSVETWEHYIMVCLEQMKGKNNENTL